MRILTVIDHPDPGSFTHAVAARFGKGAAAAGHDVTVSDLHRDGFDPRWSRADAAQFDGAPPPPDIAKAQAQIAAADALCLVFPLYWFGMPAMTKGWIDRVWSWGWAYDEIEDPPTSLLPEKRALFLIPAAANPANWRKHGYEASMRQLWGPGTLAFFGMPRPQIEFLGGVDGAAERREAHLDRVEALGRGF